MAKSLEKFSELSPDLSDNSILYSNLTFLALKELIYTEPHPQDYITKGKTKKNLKYSNEVKKMVVLVLGYALENSAFPSNFCYCFCNGKKSEVSCLLMAKKVRAIIC